MRPLDADERALWARVIASVEPLEGKRAAAPATMAEAMRSPPVSVARPRRPEPPAPPKIVAPAPPRPNTLDGSWDRRLSRGLVEPDLAVDLHGHTLDSAWRVLDGGLETAIRRGARLLLLVTGKPRAPGSGRGAIRAAVGDWLGASRHADSIAAVRGAHPRHGGAGALYIILRRPRGRIS
jgi:DNA-nicking Smr family endonuclease